MPAPKQTHAAASKLAQLLGETIIHHAPHTARIGTDEIVRQVNDWLEGLEQHHSNLLSPFLQTVLDNSNPPPELRRLIEEAINPQHQFGATLLQIFMWGVVSNLIGTSIAPFEQGVINDLWSLAVSQGISIPLSPSNAATAAARGLNLGDKPTVTVPQWAYDEAAQTGTSKEQMDLLASIVGLPPALQELFELYRRGDITLDEVKQGLREGDFRDDWIDRTIGLAHAWLTPLDFVRAAVQAQMTYADAREWANKTGLETSTQLPLSTGGTEATPDMFGLAFSIAGRPPGPAELGRMALRGIIPWSGAGADKTSFQQGIAESDVKTKWTDALQALTAYVPPPRSVGTLLAHGGITAAQAQQLWEMSGVPPELAKAYVYQVEQEHVSQDKLQTRSTITTAYYDGLLSEKQAKDALGLLGYRGTVADEILAITAFRRELAQINRVVSTIASAFTKHKLTAADARTALQDIGLEDPEIRKLLAVWEAERNAPLQLPTEAQITGAFHYGIISQDEAMSKLETLGYRPYDAWLILSERQHGPLPGKPAQTTEI